MALNAKIMLVSLTDEAGIYKILSTKKESPNTKFDNIKEEEDGYGIEPWNLEGWENSESNEIFCFFKTKKSSTGKGICRESKVKSYYWKNKRSQSICNEKACVTVLSFCPIKGYRKEFQNGWAIHEYKLKECNVGSDWVLCRVMNKTKEFTTPKIRQLKRKLKEFEADLGLNEEQRDPYGPLNESDNAI